MNWFTDPVDDALQDLYLRFWRCVSRGDVPGVMVVTAQADELQALNPRAMNWSEGRYEMNVVGALVKGEDASVVGQTAHLAAEGRRLLGRLVHAVLPAVEDPVAFARAIALVNLGRPQEALAFAERHGTTSWARWLAVIFRNDPGAAELHVDDEVGALRQYLRHGTSLPQ